MSKDKKDFKDLPKAELLVRMQELINAGWTVFVKFTCLHCGSRQTSDTPNKLHLGGYTCEECGKVSYPIRYGLLIMTRGEGSEDESLFG
jgi:hypothetical protein